MYGDQVATKQCYLVMVSTKATMKKVQLVEEEKEILENVGRIPEAKVVEDRMLYDLNEPSYNSFFLLGSNLTEWERTELIEFLIINIKVFA